MTSDLVFVLLVNSDTWKQDRWVTVGVFTSESEAESQGRRFKESAGNYAGYRIVRVTVNPRWGEWGDDDD